MTLQPINEVNMMFLEKLPVFDTIDDDGITTNCLSETDPEVVGC